MLSHQHVDHFDLELIDMMKHLPGKLVIPEILLPQFEDLAGFPWEKVIVPIPMRPFKIKGITITVFDGLHWEKWVHPKKNIQLANSAEYPRWAA